MKVIIIMIFNDLIHSMLLLYYKRINILLYIQLISFIISDQFQFNFTLYKRLLTWYLILYEILYMLYEIKIRAVIRSKQQIHFLLH